MLFDTYVLIWYLRGNVQAAELLDQTTTRQTSVISYMELLQGCRGMEQQRRIRDFLSAFDFTVMALSENIGHRAAIYMEQHSPATGLSAMDALIAATAVESHSVLATGNVKHFSRITELRVTRFKA